MHYVVAGFSATKQLSQPPPDKGMPAQPGQMITCLPGSKFCESSNTIMYVCGVAINMLLRVHIS